MTLQNTPLAGKLWGVFWQYLNKNGTCCSRTTLHKIFIFSFYFFNHLVIIHSMSCPMPSYQSPTPRVLLFCQLQFIQSPFFVCLGSIPQNHCIASIMSKKGIQNGLIEAHTARKLPFKHQGRGADIDVNEVRERARPLQYTRFNMVISQWKQIQLRVKTFSYMLNCEYRVTGSQYSQSLFTSENCLSTNLHMQEQLKDKM